MRYKRELLILACCSLFAYQASANCNCGSVDAANPCTGTSITVSVKRSYTVAFAWEFNSGGTAASCGQFANGDYWVAPAAGKSAVTITSISGSGSGTVSADDDPQLESTGILGASNKYGNGDTSENLIGKLPVTYGSSVSILAAIQRDESKRGACGTKQITGACVDAYNVLTVLDAVPQNAGSTVLRPNVSGSVKELVSFDQLNLNAFPRRAFFVGTDQAGVEEIRQKWSHCSEVLGVKGINGETWSEGGRAFRAEMVCGNYGARIARSYYDDLAYLMSQNTPREIINPAVAAMITYGKDIFHAIYDCDDGLSQCTRIRNWGSGAGQSLGKFPPAVIFAALAKNAKYGEYLQKTSTDLLGYADIRGPQELEQINPGANGPIWGDEPDDLKALDYKVYWGRLFASQCYDGAKGNCVANTGNKTMRDPHGYIDGPPGHPGTQYMGVSAGPMRALVGMMYLMPEICEIVNYTPLVEYMDRLSTYGIKSSNDPCAPPDPREDLSKCQPYKDTGCLYYGQQNLTNPTWGPDPANPKQCIQNNSGGNSGQNGRFPGRNGVNVNFGNDSSQFQKNWSSIRGNLKNIDCTIVNPPAKTNASITDA